jgi:hypothetical protein
MPRFWWWLFNQLFNWIDLRLKADPAWSQCNLLLRSNHAARRPRIYKSRKTSFPPDLGARKQAERGLAPSLIFIIFTLAAFKRPESREAHSASIETLDWYK